MVKIVKAPPPNKNSGTARFGPTATSTAMMKKANISAIKIRYGANSGNSSISTSAADTEDMIIVRTASRKNRLVPSQDNQRSRCGPMASTRGPLPPAVGRM